MKHHYCNICHLVSYSKLAHEHTKAHLQNELKYIIHRLVPDDDLLSDDEFE